MRAIEAAAAQVKDAQTLSLRAGGDVVELVGEVVHFFSSRRRHTRLQGDWSSDVCSSDLNPYPQFWKVMQECPDQKQRRHGRPHSRWVSARQKSRSGALRRTKPQIATTRRAWRGQIGRASCRERV